jgi:hypothetical protein
MTLATQARDAFAGEGDRAKVELAEVTAWLANPR